MLASKKEKGAQRKELPFLLRALPGESQMTSSHGQAHLTPREAVILSIYLYTRGHWEVLVVRKKRGICHRSEFLRKQYLKERSACRT